MSSWDCLNCGLTNSVARIQCLACFTTFTLQPKAKEVKWHVDQRKNIEFLICGYIRENEEELKLYMNIPSGIAEIIHELYPVLLFRFGDCTEGVFKLDDDRLILEGGNPMDARSCNGHFIYADLGQFNNIGFNQGIHLWSIKNLNEFGSCFRSIGVTTEKNDEIINEFSHNGRNSCNHWMKEEENTCHSYYEGFDWGGNQTITVKLNCNDWIVTYYTDGEEFNKDLIEADRSYYFAFMCCNALGLSHFQVVEDPIVN